MNCYYSSNGKCEVFSNEWVNANCITPFGCPFRKAVPVTNADMIREADDNELAEFLSNMELFAEKFGGDSKSGWLEFLQTPAEEE